MSSGVIAGMKNYSSCC